MSVGAEILYQQFNHNRRKHEVVFFEFYTVDLSFFFLLYSYLVHARMLLSTLLKAIAAVGTSKFCFVLDVFKVYRNGCNA